MSWAGLGKLDLLKGQRVDLELPDRGKCFYGDNVSRCGMVDTVGLAELVIVTVTAGIANGNGAAESDAHPVCTDADAGEQYTFQATIPLADVTNRGVNVAAPDDAPYAFTLQIADWVLGGTDFGPAHGGDNSVERPSGSPHVRRVSNSCESSGQGARGSSGT